MVGRLSSWLGGDTRRHGTCGFHTPARRSSIENLLTQGSGSKFNFEANPAPHHGASGHRGSLPRLPSPRTEYEIRCFPYFMTFVMVGRKMPPICMHCSVAFQIKYLAVFV
jgi:hypothetical protein